MQNSTSFVHFQSLLSREGIVENKMLLSSVFILPTLMLGVEKALYNQQSLFLARLRISFKLF